MDRAKTPTDAQRVIGLNIVDPGSTGTQGKEGFRRPRGKGAGVHSPVTRLSANLLASRGRLTYRRPYGMLVKRDIERKLRGEDIPSGEITDHGVYLNRRAFMVGAAAVAVVSAPWGREASAEGNLQPLQATKNPGFQVQEAPPPYKHVTSYNNFYEFGTNKEDPERMQASLKTRPWTVQVDGLCAKPKTFGIEELLKFPLEDRVYRLRCVEAWSMVIPWIGFPLKDLLKRVEPTGQAKYVEFTTLVNPEMFPGQKRGIFGFSLDWPYAEGPRLDEAMHPLTLGRVGRSGAWPRN